MNHLRQTSGSALVSVLLLIALAALVATAALAAVSLRASSADARMGDLALTQLSRTVLDESMSALAAMTDMPETDTLLLDDTPLPDSRRCCSVTARKGARLTLTARVTRGDAARTARQVVIALRSPDALSLDAGSTTLLWGEGTRTLSDDALARAPGGILCYGEKHADFHIGSGTPARIAGSLRATCAEGCRLTLTVQSALTLTGDLHSDGKTRMLRDVTCRRADIGGELDFASEAVLTADTVILRQQVDADTLSHIDASVIYMAGADGTLSDILPLPESDEPETLYFYDAGPL